MPLTLEQRLALRDLGIEPRLGEDFSTGGLYGMPDAMNPGGLRQDPSTRDFRNRAMPQRLSQPQLGPIPAGDPVADQEAQRAAAMAQLAGMQGAAPGIIEGLGSSRQLATQEILDRLRDPMLSPDERRNMAFAGLNLDMDPSGRFPQTRSTPSQPSTRTYSDQRMADLAQREANVKMNAADRRDARKMRMGQGPAMFANRALGMQQQAMDMVNGGGGGAPAAAGDNPAAAGPAGGFIDPIAGAMAGIPPALIAERNDNTRFRESLALQRAQHQAALNDDTRKVVANTGGSPRDLVAVGSTPEQMDQWDASQAPSFMAMNPTASRDELEAHLVSKGVDPQTAGVQAFLLRTKYPHLFPAPQAPNPIMSGLQAIGGQAMAAMPALGPAARDARQTAIDWLNPLVGWTIP